VQLKIPSIATVAGAIPILAALAALSTRPVAAADTGPPASAPVRDGSHDFDFIYGRWRMPNHRLKKRLAGSHEWADFVTCDEGSPLPGGIGNIDYWKASYWKDFVGVTVRTYDPKSGLWRIYWVDNKFSAGVILPPVVGKFERKHRDIRGRRHLRGQAHPCALHLDNRSGRFAGLVRLGAGGEPQGRSRSS
jgi:hypothetical protein